MKRNEHHHHHQYPHRYHHHRRRRQSAQLRWMKLEWETTVPGQAWRYVAVVVGSGIGIGISR